VVVSLAPLPMIRRKLRSVLEGYAVLLPEMLVVAVSVWSFGRLFASTFHPFIYFRF
jgi:hypothetical protein